jgi:PAT family beta-lactamase induction signal transducer AmpG
LKRRQKLTLLTTLYLAQGLPYGFFTLALPVFLREAHLSLPAIGLTNLLTLPWALKFLWAPQVDRRRIPGFGLRRSWLLPAQFASILLYALLGLFTLRPGEISVILAGCLLANLFAASQDIATDALAVDILEPNERGWANGIQVAGYRAGMIVGGWFLVSLYPILGWTGDMLLMSALVAICTLPVLLFKEPAHHSPSPKSRAAFLETIGFFLNRGAGPWALVLLLYKFGHAAASTMIRPWLFDNHYPLQDIGWILGGVGFAAGLVGAILGGGLAVQKGRARLLIGLGVLQVLGLASYVWPVITEHSTFKILVAAFLDNFTSGLATTVLFTIMMDACSKVRAASDYTAQACTVVVSQSVAGIFAGFAAQAWGYPIFFFVSALIGAGALVVTAFVITLPSVRGLINPMKDSRAA